MTRGHWRVAGACVPPGVWLACAGAAGCRLGRVPDAPPRCCCLPRPAAGRARGAAAKLPRPRGASQRAALRCASGSLIRTPPRFPCGALPRLPHTPRPGCRARTRRCGGCWTRCVFVYCTQRLRAAATRAVDATCFARVLNCTTGRNACARLSADAHPGFWLRPRHGIPGRCGHVAARAAREHFRGGVPRHDAPRGCAACGCEQRRCSSDDRQPCCCSCRRQW